jgi:hypothetical protein
MEIIGDKPIDDISRSDANRVLNQIKLLPANTAKYRNNTVPEILEPQVTTGAAKLVKSVQNFPGSWRKER